MLALLVMISFSVVIGGPFDSRVGFPSTRPGFRSNIVRGLIATILAPIGPECGQIGGREKRVIRPQLGDKYNWKGTSNCRNKDTVAGFLCPETTKKYIHKWFRKVD